MVGGARITTPEDSFNGLAFQNFVGEKFIWVNQGGRLIFGLPIQTCIMVLCDAKKLKAEDIDDINDLANFLVDMSPKDLTSNGGFYIYVNEGQGIGGASFVLDCADQFWPPQIPGHCTQQPEELYVRHPRSSEAILPCF